MYTPPTTASELRERYAAGDRQFRGSQLSEVDLAGADLSDACLRNSILRRVSFRGATLALTDLSGASLRDADLSDACLMSANLNDANLRDACLRGADLRGATLRGAYLAGADMTGAQLPHFQIPEGDLVVYKRVDYRIIELLIPARARRTASLVSRKCRAEYAIVRRIDGDPLEFHHKGEIYRTGAEIWAESYCDDIRIDWGPGVSFYLTRAEAEERRYMDCLD